LFSKVHNDTSLSLPDQLKISKALNKFLRQIDDLIEDNLEENQVKSWRDSSQEAWKGGKPVRK